MEAEGAASMLNKSNKGRTAPESMNISWNYSLENICDENLDGE